MARTRFSFWRRERDSEPQASCGMCNLHKTHCNECKQRHECERTFAHTALRVDTPELTMWYFMTIAELVH